MPKRSVKCRSAPSEAARQPANQLPQTDTQTRPGNGHKYEKRNYGIRNAGMADLVLGDQKRRMETLFS